MKQYKSLQVAALLCGLAGMVFYSAAAYSQLVTNTPPDVSSNELRAIVIEDFETGADWTLKSDPKAFENVGNDPKKAEKNPVVSLEAKMIQGGPSDLRVEQWAANNKGLKKERCLGVLFEFKYPGNNAVHVIPPEPIRIPGRASQLSMWVHGRGDNYNLEVWLKDWRGNTHVLQMGQVKFVGWKPITVSIPPYIPQAVDTYPQTKTLVLERFVLRADAREEAKRVFFAFDQLKALSETFEVNFDGQELDSVFQNNNGQGQGGNNR